MGQAPASGRISLRTVPRNFPGRSGTREDSVYLYSPETAAASALTGVITDPRDLSIPYERIKEPKRRNNFSEGIIQSAAWLEGVKAAVWKHWSALILLSMQPMLLVRAMDF
jgi:aconitate hydratase